MEHVVADMTTFALGIVHGVGGATLAEAGRNLGTVLVGNVVGGAVFVGLAVWVGARADRPSPVPTTDEGVGVTPAVGEASSL